MNFYAFLGLWLAGIVFGSSTVTFILWQLQWITILNAANLVALAAWLIFTSVVAIHNKLTALANTLIGLAIVPFFSSLWVASLLDEEIQQSFLGNVVGGAMFLLLFVVVGCWCFNQDVQQRLKKG